MIALIFSVFLITLFLGFPVAICLALTTVSGLLFQDLPLTDCLRYQQDMWQRWSRR